MMAVGRTGIDLRFSGFSPPLQEYITLATLPQEAAVRNKEGILRLLADIFATNGHARFEAQI
jgi:hypothetical protein